MRRLAYMVACGVVLAGPALAGERVDVWRMEGCRGPLAQMSGSQLQGCLEAQRNAEELLRLVYPNGAPREGERSITVIRGGRVESVNR